MALKRKLTKSEYEALKADVKSEYKADGDNFVLDIDGDDDNGALKRAKDREAQRASDEKKRADELQAQLDELTGNDAKKRGDIETLTKQHDAKVKELKDAHKAEANKLKGQLEGILVDAAAQSMAAKISTSPAVIMPHIKGRLVADLTGETPVTKVRDKDGKVSDMTLEDLSKEFVANKDFAAIMVASKATGGGAPGRQQQQQPASGGGGDKQKTILETPVSDRIAQLREKHAEQDAASGKQ